MKLETATAVVTGAGTGIGRAISQAIAGRGARVALLGRNRVRLEQTQDSISRRSGQARIFQVDLRDQNAISRVGREIFQVWPTVDIVVNAAAVWHDEEGAFYGKDLHEMPAHQIVEVLDVGIQAPMLLTRLFLPGMTERRHGKVLNISGTFAHNGAGWLHYYVSKKALEFFTIGLADEMRKYEIQVNCISPSDVATEALCRFFPDDAKMALASDDVARFALFLLSEDADNVTGQIIVVKSKTAH